ASAFRRQTRPPPEGHADNFQAARYKPRTNHEAQPHDGPPRDIGPPARHPRCYRTNQETRTYHHRLNDNHPPETDYPADPTEPLSLLPLSAPLLRTHYALIINHRRF